jgi:hypothetical protein
MDTCALPGCPKPIKNWRTHFCCISHAGKYSALARHHRLPKLPSKTIGVKTKPRSPNGSKMPPKPYNEWTPEQKGKYIAYVVERRKKRDKSMPLWANKKAIQAIYIEARRLTAETGIKYEVDHIIPSNHALVCGLHVESNLQILTESENISKYNKFEI